MSLHIGTCGFSYREWIGPFYPEGIKALEMLPFYAKRFGAVEIDSTYYAIPKPALFESMDRRTPAHFRFTVKVPGSVTHIPADAHPTREDVKGFYGSLEPLMTSKKLAAVLAQFPNSFRPVPDAYERLKHLREWWPDINVIAEFRHRDWQNDRTLQVLRDLKIGWCNVDEPRFRSLLRPGSEVTSPIGYIRFHGRNYGQWWKKEEKPAPAAAGGAKRDSGARYDYSYTKPELEEWIPRIAAVAEQTRDTYVFFNNHRLGKAALNATTLSEMLR